MVLVLLPSGCWSCVLCLLLLEMRKPPWLRLQEAVGVNGGEKEVERLPATEKFDVSPAFRGRPRRIWLHTSAQHAARMETPEQAAAHSLLLPGRRCI